MKKEAIIAIVLGFGLGIIITFGIWTANKALKTQESTTPTPSVAEETPTQISPTPTPNQGLSLEISQPENNEIITEEKINLAGKTAPEATIVILFEEGEKIIEADKEGKFETEITLIGGANEITIKAFDQKGNEAQSIIDLVYSTAKI